MNSQKRYQQSEKGKAARERYKQSEAGKASKARSNRTYHQSAKGKAAVKRYQQSAKGKATRARRAASKAEANALRFQQHKAEAIQFLRANPGKTLDDFWEFISKKSAPPMTQEPDHPSIVC